MDRHDVYQIYHVKVVHKKVLLINYHLFFHVIQHILCIRISIHLFCKARSELAKIKQTNTIERPGRSTFFWTKNPAKYVRSVAEFRFQARRIRHKPSAQRLY